jgi:hypothetical protein
MYLKYNIKKENQFMVQQNPLKSLLFRQNVIAKVEMLLRSIEDSNQEKGTLVVAQVLDHGVLSKRVYSTIKPEGINLLIESFNKSFNNIKMSAIDDCYECSGITKPKILLCVS